MSASPALSQPGQASEPSQATALPPIDVAAPPSTARTPDQTLQSDGTAADGYAASLLSGLGPLGQRRILDTPLNVSVMSSELVDNLQVYSLTDLAKVSPFIQNYVPASYTDTAGVTIRGFGTASVGSSSGVLQTQDGFKTLGSNIQDLEDKERVEVVTGVTGFLNGQNSPGGMINFVQKRPTATPLVNVTAGAFNNTSGYIHGDFGGPVPGHTEIGYRVNIVEQYGPTFISDQMTNRQLVTGAVDIHLGPDALLQVEAGYRNNLVHALEASWGVYYDTPNYPAAPDPSRNWSQKWTYNHTQTTHADTTLTWKIAPFLTSRSGFRFADQKSSFLATENDFVASNGTYDQTVWASDGFQRSTMSGYQYLDAKFDTFGAKHTLTFGANGVSQNFSTPRNWWTEDTPYYPSASSVLVGPVYIWKPNYLTSLDGSQKLRQTTQNLNLFVGDQIDITDYVTIMAGVTRATIDQFTYNPDTGVRQASYEKSSWAPAASFLVKPTDWLSTYFSYLEGVDQGQVAPTNATNSGEIMSPTRSTSYEAGVKAKLGGALFTFNYFDTERGYAFLQSNADGTRTLVQDGRERHKGVELGVSGKITDSLTLLGGVTIFDPRVTNASTPKLENKRPWDVANHMVKLYAEYDFPWLRGLTFTGGVNHVGNFYSDIYNTTKIPAYTTIDLGLRYQTAVTGTPLTFRVSVNNVADRHYWLTDSYLGSPRTVAFSVAAKF
ncbi:TonB-dependent receptor [Methylosinus sporium]|uniref:TonB-dependent receptor n=1 Tax=Methylosinus sporium TaxID=428 RepID=UPI003839E0B4